MSLRGEVTLPGAQLPDSRSEGGASNSEADVTFGQLSLQRPSPATDGEDNVNEVAETEKPWYEDICAELDAMPPAPLRLDDLPQKQADVVRTFMKHDVEPPSYSELIGPTSLESLDGFRNEPFIDVPDWEKDLMDELLGDPELIKPKNEKKLPQSRISLPISGNGPGKTNIKSQPAAKPSNNENRQHHDIAGQGTQDSAIVQEGHRASQAVSQQRQTQTPNTVAANSVQSSGYYKSAVAPATTSWQETQALPKQLLKRQRGSLPDLDDTAETGPPLKRHQQNSASPRASQGPTPISQDSSARQPPSAPLHLRQTRAPFFAQSGADLGTEGQKAGNPIHSQLGKRRREAEPSLEGFVDVDLAQPSKRHHTEAAEISSLASLIGSPVKSGGQLVTQSTQNPRYTRPPPRPQQLPRSTNQQTRPMAPYLQSVGPACGGHPMSAPQVPSHVGSQNSVPIVKPSPASVQYSYRWDPSNGTEPSTSKVRLQNPTQRPQTTGRFEPHESSSLQPVAKHHTDPYKIELNGRLYQLPLPPAWMDEEVATWKGQKSTLPPQLPPRQSNAGFPIAMKQLFPSGAPPQRQVLGSANGRAVLPPNGPLTYDPNVEQPSGSRPTPRHRAAPYEGARQQQAHLGLDRPDGRPGTHIPGYKPGNSMDDGMRQVMNSQQSGLSCQSSAKHASGPQQEGPWTNGGPQMSGSQGQFDLNGGQEIIKGGLVATSVYSNHPAAMTPYQLADITNDYNEQYRVAEKDLEFDAQLRPNDLGDAGNIPAWPAQEFYPFPRATNRVPSQMKTNVVSQPQLDNTLGRTTSQPPPPYQPRLQQFSLDGGPSRPRGLVAPRQPPLDSSARDQWEILEAQNAHATGNPASSHDVMMASHTYPSIHTAETTRSLDNLQPGHGTMKTPIKTDDEVQQKPQAATDIIISAASLKSKSAESADVDQGSTDPGSGGWNDVKPWNNEDELDDYLAQELADFPEEEEAHDNLQDGQTDETTTVSAAAADPVPKPIFANYRDQVPQTDEDELSVNQAIQHTYNDLQNKLGYDVVAAAYVEKAREATKESYGHQYNTLQARYVDQLVGKHYLATTKRSKKQKKAERAVGFLYEVEGPWKAGFADWKATNAPALPTNA